MDRRTFLMAAAAAGLQGVAGTARAADFPGRPISLIVPYAAGGNGDFTARTFGDAFAQVIGQPVVVENRAGAGGAIGAGYVARAKPDGYTLIAAAKGVFSITPNLVDVSYGMDDFRAVGFISQAPMVLVVKNDSKYRTLEDFIQDARSAPGRVSLGIGAMGSDNHVAMLHLELAANCSFNPLAYKGAGPMMLDLMGGHIDAGIDQLTTSKPLFEAKSTRPLAVLGLTRHALLPSVPTIESIGCQPFDSTTYIGLLAPRGTPDAVLAALNEARSRALQSPKVQQAFLEAGGAVYDEKPDQLEKLVREESDFIKAMLKEGKVEKS